MNDLPELLELGVVTEEVEVAEASLTTSCCSCNGGSSLRTGAASATSTLSLLGCEIEEIDALAAFFTTTGGGTTGSWGSSSSLLGRSRAGLLLWLLLEIVRDTLQGN